MATLAGSGKVNVVLSALALVTAMIVTGLYSIEKIHTRLQQVPAQGPRKLPVIFIQAGPEHPALKVTKVWR